MSSVTELLHTKYPLVQAPMNWATDARFVAAVANAGALGVLGPNAGLSEMVHGSAAHKRQLQAQLDQVRTLTDQPIGINVVLEPDPAPHMNSTLEVAFANGLRYFAVVGEPDQAVYRRIKDHGGVILARPLTPTVANAKAAEAYGADILVATGYDEGGILPQHFQGTFTVVPTMADAVSIPVLAAGGINDARGVRAALVLGAQGVYVGTRFLVTAEAPVAPAAKETLLAGSYDQVDLVSHDQRSLMTPGAKQLAARFKETNDGRAIDQIIAQRGGMLPGLRLGQVDDNIISTNTGLDLIKHGGTVAELVEELMEGIK
ncbi:nitronate monooxygenase [Limosilactobacillus fermentum]